MTRGAPRVVTGAPESGCAPPPKEARDNFAEITRNSKQHKSHGTVGGPCILGLRSGKLHGRQAPRLLNDLPHAMYKPGRGGRGIGTRGGGRRAAERDLPLALISLDGLLALAGYICRRKAGRSWTWLAERRPSRWDHRFTSEPLLTTSLPTPSMDQQVANPGAGTRGRGSPRPSAATHSDDSERVVSFIEIGTRSGELDETPPPCFGWAKVTAFGVICDGEATVRGPGGPGRALPLDNFRRRHRIVKNTISASPSNKKTIIPLSLKPGTPQRSEIRRVHDSHLSFDAVHLGRQLWGRCIERVDHAGRNIYGSLSERGVAPKSAGTGLARRGPG